MMVSAPGYAMTARAAVEDTFSGEAGCCARAAEFVRRVRESVATTSPVHLSIHETIPEHAGLGSGTQLALAVALALSRLSGECSVPVETLARRAGRGLRSAIGLHGFAQGGFLVDGGRAGSGQLGTLVSRIETPVNWRVILVAPPQSRGLSGEQEQRAFASQPPMSQSLTAELCRIALMDWMPGIIEADFDRVSNAMYDFGLNVGKFFEPAQGGVFAHPLMQDLVTELRRRGVAGVAQTSWGPTICVLCESESSAGQIVSDLEAKGRWSDCLFRIVQPMNTGAVISL